MLREKYLCTLYTILDSRSLTQINTTMFFSKTILFYHRRFYDLSRDFSYKIAFIYVFRNICSLNVVIRCSSFRKYNEISGYERILCNRGLNFYGFLIIAFWCSSIQFVWFNYLIMQLCNYIILCNYITAIDIMLKFCVFAIIV